VSKAVITVPAYFNDAQRQATKDAGRFAGLEVMRIVNERLRRPSPTGSTRRRTRRSPCTTSAGGTFEHLNSRGGEGVVEVKATKWRHASGRRQPRSTHHRWIITEFKNSEGIDLGKDRMALQRLKESAEKAKMELSTVMETDINLPFITADASDQASADEAVAAKFEQLVDDSPAEDRRADQAGARRCRPRSLEDRRGRPRRRIDAHPEGAADRQGSVPARAAQGGQPG